jgi:hypothetical protein
LDIPFYSRRDRQVRLHDKIGTLTSETDQVLQNSLIGEVPLHRWRPTAYRVGLVVRSPAIPGRDEFG